MSGSQNANCTRKSQSYLALVLGPFKDQVVVDSVLKRKLADASPGFECLLYDATFGARLRRRRYPGSLPMLRPRLPRDTCMFTWMIALGYSVGAGLRLTLTHY